MDKIIQKKNKFSIDSCFSIMLLLRPYVLPYKKYLVCTIIALVITAFSILMMSHSIRYIIDNGFTNKFVGGLNKSIIYMMLLVFVLATGSAVRFFFITYVGEKAISDMRADIYSKILKLSATFLENRSTGDLLSHLTNDVASIQIILGSSISMLLRNFITVTGGVIMLFITNYKLTIIMLLFIPVIVTVIIIFGRKTRKLSKNTQKIIADMSGICEETFNNIKAIQAYAHEDFEKNKFNVKIQEELSVALLRIKNRAILTFLVIFLSFSAISIVLWIGGMDVIAGDMSPGQLSSFIFLSILCATSGGAFVEVINNINNAHGASMRISEFLNINIEIEGDKGAKNIEDLSADVGEDIHKAKAKAKNKNKAKNPIIEFKNVTFYYPSKKEKPAIKNLSIKIYPGTITAIVGKSGAGKSTLYQLLLRFYNLNLVNNTKIKSNNIVDNDNDNNNDKDTGEILFYGHNIKKIKLKSLRSHFAYVSQDPYIFSDTIYANIAYGKLDANKEDVEVAAKAAMAMEFIEKLPMGLDEYVGEKGVRLSGGQKQRISIARAILKNPEILLLDEATSSLDGYNEKMVHRAMNEIMKNRTTIVIAHREETIKNADNVIVIKEGEIIEYGKYHDIARKGSEYIQFILGGCLNNDV